MTQPSDTDSLKALMRDRGICVVIPTYNNRGSIAAVVAGVQQMCDDVIVVDDGSTDGSTDILRATPGIELVSYPRNRGKGYALRQGFRRAIGLGFAYAITIDADGQHYPADIARLVEANCQHPGCIIVGQRDLTGTVRSAGSTFANRFSNFWFYVQTGRRLPDTQSGFRLYPLGRSVVGRMAPKRWSEAKQEDQNTKHEGQTAEQVGQAGQCKDQSGQRASQPKQRGGRPLLSRYEAEVELLVLASWHGVGIHSVPVGVYYPPADERVSHFRPMADFARISVLNTVLCVLAFVYGLPLRLGRFLLRYLRTVYATVFFVVSTLLVVTPWVWVVTHVGAMTEAKRRHLHRLIYRASRFVMIKHGLPGVRFRTKVDAAADFSKPRVIICNHQSHFDLACQLVFTPNVVFLTKDWVWNNPFYGMLIRNAEYLPVRDGIEALLPQLRSLVDRGYSIAVYPEGTRSADCRIGRFHQGAFYIARELGLDVLPMYLYGPGKVLQKHSHHLNPGVIQVEVGRPFTQAELNAVGDLRHQARYMRHHYIDKCQAMANEIERHV